MGLEEEAAGSEGPGWQKEGRRRHKPRGRGDAGTPSSETGQRLGVDVNAFLRGRAGTFAGRQRYIFKCRNPWLYCFLLA